VTTNEQKEQLDEQGKRRKNNNSIRLAGVVLLIIAALLIGLLINQNNKEVVVPGVQPSKEQQNTEKKTQTSKTPEQIIKEYYTALKNGDYEKAASYISQDAKRVDKRLAENAADQLHKRDLNKKPVVDFVVDEISDQNGYKVVNLKVKRQSYSSAKSEDMILELENGEWKVNPTGMIGGSISLKKNFFTNKDLEIKAVDVQVGPSETTVKFSIAQKSNNVLYIPGTTETATLFKSEFILTTDQGAYTETTFSPFTGLVGQGAEGFGTMNDGVWNRIIFKNATGTPRTLKLVTQLSQRKKSVRGMSHLDS
jgi:hypothetical protein